MLIGHFTILRMNFSRSCFKSVAQALPTYVMSVFKLPLTLCDDLMKHIWVFWWGAENGKWKIQSKPWEQMILPKSSGALGFKDLRLFNQALLARHVWRLVAFPDSLCARLLKAKYFSLVTYLIMFQQLKDPKHGDELDMAWR